MKNIVMESEARRSACMALFFSIFTGNFLGVVSSSVIMCDIKALPERWAQRRGNAKCWYILAMVYFITLLTSQASVLYAILIGRSRTGLIGMIVPLSILGTSGLWFLHSAYIAYTKLYPEESITRGDGGQPPIVAVQHPPQMHQVPEATPMPVSQQQPNAGVTYPLLH